MALPAQHLVGVIPSFVFVLMMAKVCGLTGDVEAAILEAGARLLSHLSDRVSSSPSTPPGGGEPARINLLLIH